MDQPDGGRDAFAQFSEERGEKNVIVFQVKFSTDPNAKTERDVIAQCINTEKDKINRLKSLGNVSYYLITNVRGTSHLRTGSIDKVNEQLAAAFEIPSYCWWRDDLDARVSSHSSVKWSFPEILRGTDVLQLLVERNDASSERRDHTIRAYVASQYQEDEKLKFKQVELQNFILKLFVDIPAQLLNGSEKQKVLFGALLLFI